MTNNVSPYRRPSAYELSKLKTDNLDYQYGNPSLETERDYYNCVRTHCKGHMDNECLEACRIKSHALKPFPGIPEMNCAGYKGKAYYKCLVENYAGFRYP